MPVLDEPVTPVLEEPVAPVLEEPVAPVLDEPVAPVLDEPVAPVLDEPVEPVVDVPVEPVVDVPVEPVVEPPDPAADALICDSTLLKLRFVISAVYVPVRNPFVQVGAAANVALGNPKPASNSPPTRKLF